MSSVDVVIPCYNYARFLPQCVRSVLEQDGVDVRVLIIDDCSTDDTPDIGHSSARDDNRVTFRRHAKNWGHIATYNEGLLEWADSEYAFLLSADDIIAPGALARAAQVMSDPSGVGMCFGQQLVFDGQPPAMHCDRKSGFSFDVLSGQEFIETAFRTGANPVSTPTVLVRTVLQKSIGGYKQELPHTADLEMWLRFAAKSPVARINALQAYKREHPNNMLKKFTPTILPDLNQRKLAFEGAFHAFAGEVKDADQLLRQAMESLATQAFWGAHAQFEAGNDELCDGLLEFGASLDDSWPESPAWKRLRWKRRMGSRMWRVIRPLSEFVRSRPQSAQVE